MNDQEIDEWVGKAEQDWQAILQLLAGKPEAVPDIIAFHAQQTTEKYLKALLLNERSTIRRLKHCEKMQKLFHPLLYDLVTPGFL